VLILWGYNPSFTRLTHATAVAAALKRGMRLIVVDPRHVGFAGKAVVSGSGRGRCLRMADYVRGRRAPRGAAAG